MKRVASGVMPDLIFISIKVIRLTPDATHFVSASNWGHPLCVTRTLYKLDAGVTVAPDD